MAKKLRAPASSRGDLSPLVAAFAARAGRGEDTGPEQILELLIRDHRGKKKVPPTGDHLDLFLQSRKIVEVHGEKGLNCDGLIEPIGQTYDSGFRIKVNKSMPAVRRRFTLAHEACHTFFYEFVPEVKFSPHAEDEDEERLCNLGAAMLLIPAHALKRKAKALPRSMDTLQDLASDFGVSMPTMLLRLRTVGLWHLEFSTWRRLTNGTFAMDHLYGGQQAQWKWMDEGEIGIAWKSRGPVFGRSFVYAQSRRGTRQFKPVSYEALRRGEELLVLWGEGLARSEPRSARLF
jgi:hypothetical protein